MKRGELIHALIAQRDELSRIIGALQKPRDAEQAPPKPGADYPVDENGQFSGRAISAKYAGVCCVCGAKFEAGETIVYRDRHTAHHGCGRSTTTRGSEA